MVYHRSDSTTGSGDSRREAEKSWGDRDSNAESAAEPAKNSGEMSRSGDESADDNSTVCDLAKYSDDVKSSDGKYSENHEGRHQNYEGRYSNYEGRYSDNFRSRNGSRDEGSRYSRNSRSRDDDRYARSRDDRREGFRDKDRYDSPRYSDRSRYRDSSRYDRYEEGSRRSESSRYSERSRYSEDSRYPDDAQYGDDSRYSDSSRYQDDSRHAEGSRYSEGSRYRGGRNEDWYNRESGRYSSSRYDDDSRYGGESSRHWRDRDQDMSPGDAGTVYSEPEQEKVKNVFQNDGSFLEMFKKMQEANKPPATQEETETSDTSTAAVPTVSKEQPVAPESTTSVVKRPALSIVGKRRGGRVLPTGMVKKQKKEEEVEETPKDAWSLYIAEVRKYKEASCEEEGKTRPLVK